MPRRIPAGCAVLLVGFVLALASSSAASDKLFGTGPLYHSASVLIDTICIIHNAGSKPVVIRSVGIPGYSPSVGTASATSENCTAAPLAPDRSRFFSGSLGVYGGGVARVKGSTKNLRGECSAYAGGNSVMTVPMR